MDVDELSIVVVLGEWQKTADNISIRMEIQGFSFVRCSVIGFHRWEIERILLSGDTYLTDIEDIAMAEELVPEVS